eukprot:TRINITY_DN7348_c0_g1_i1.p1 TRINITY_DN7348_c0_g1~~TRINITY_DN7348_c0_g1_i1.p1  ORF type:complete len:216 (-),score=41.47 TRINITY_DN7348_c0_g1_i1:374-1021(-)
MIRRPPRSTLSSSSAASDVYKRQVSTQSTGSQQIGEMGNCYGGEAKEKAVPVKPTQPRLPPPNDPFNLGERFVKTQRLSFGNAISEVRSGEKRGCWSWYVLPTEPYTVQGREAGSYKNRHYALRDPPPNHLTGTAAARAYLEWEDSEVSLRGNYITIVTAITQQVENGRDPRALLGKADVGKYRSSLNLFKRASFEKDEEVFTLCERGIKALDDG